MAYIGTIIEESLSDNRLMSSFKIIRTKIEKVNDRHKTPWLKSWTLHEIEVPDDAAESTAHMLSGKIEASHNAWYIDFKNDQTHYIIFPGNFDLNRIGRWRSYFGRLHLRNLIQNRALVSDDKV